MALFVTADDGPYRVMGHEAKNNFLSTTALRRGRKMLLVSGPERVRLLPIGGVVRLKVENGNNAVLSSSTNGLDTIELLVIEDMTKRWSQ